MIGGRFADQIDAGNGQNVILGDSGRLTDAGAAPGTPVRGRIPLGLIESQAYSDGGDDSIRSGSGDDIILGGDAADRIDADGGDNIVLGDNGRIDFTRRDRVNSGALAADQGEVIAVTATIESLSPTEFGGADQITSGAGSDIMIGGRYGDTMTDLGGSNILLGDSVVLVAASRVTSPHTPLRSLAFARISSISDSPEHASDTIWSDGDNDLVIGGTGADSIYTGSGTDIVFGDEVDVWSDSDQLIDITIDAFRTTRAAQIGRAHV